jgi:hypothetical protein
LHRSKEEIANSEKTRRQTATSARRICFGSEKADADRFVAQLLWRRFPDKDLNITYNLRYRKNQAHCKNAGLPNDLRVLMRSPGCGRWL